MKLTKRGRIVRNFFITIILIAIFAWLFDITTPKQCKVPIEVMSQYCKDLLYP
jgi:hypothetical protein